MLTMTLASCATAGQTTSATVAASTASLAGRAPTPSPSPVFSTIPESLIGTWAMIGGFVQMFDADGRYRAYHLGHSLQKWSS